MTNLSDFYKTLNAQAASLIEGENHLIPNLANISALLFQSLKNINWAGFYTVEKDDDKEYLLLGPFQGKPACIRIPFGKGVCGTAVTKNQTQLVEDVHKFPGHIACDSASNSEIVIPIHKNGKVIAVLDIDSPFLSRFTTDDKEGLEKLVETLEKHLAS